MKNILIIVFLFSVFFGSIASAQIQIWKQKADNELSFINNMETGLIDNDNIPDSLRYDVDKKEIRYYCILLIPNNE